MRHTTARPIRTMFALAAAGTLALTACGSDGDGGGAENESTEAFCADLLAIYEADAEIDDAAGLTLLRNAANSAPSEISDEMNQFADIFERATTLDQETATDDEIAEFDALADDFDAAGVSIEAFASENCPDLPEDFFGGG